MRNHTPEGELTSPGLRMRSLLLLAALAPLATGWSQGCAAVRAPVVVPSSKVSASAAARLRGGASAAAATSGWGKSAGRHLRAVATVSAKMLRFLTVLRHLRAFDIALTPAAACSCRPLAGRFVGDR